MLDELYIRGLHYQHSFTYKEVDRLIEAVLLSGTLATGEAEALTEKLERCLATRFYHKGPKQICTVLTPKLTPPEKLRENLLACGEGRTDMSIWRVDLMTDIQVMGERALNKGRIQGLPSRWTEEFQLSHLNMAYDKPVSVLLRVIHGEKGGPVSYTFLHDWFGDTFRFVGREEGPPPADLVRVDCSPFAMVNWALQYSDRVEVLKPASVREEVIQKIWALERKYQIGGRENF